MDSVARTTRRLDLTASILTAAVLAVFEMGPAIAKLGFQATDTQIALITSGQSLGLIFSFFTAHLAARYSKMSLVFWPEFLARLCLGAMFFLKPTFALAFVMLHAMSQVFQQMTIPARITIYRLNYPSQLRGRVVGRNRQLQLIVTTLVAMAMSVALEWSQGRQSIVAMLGESPVEPILMVNYMIPSIAFVGVIGSFVFRLIPVREGNNQGRIPPGTLTQTAQRFWKVWRQDRDFRRYESFFIVFGFANIMSIPLTQIHAVDKLQADYFDLALINVVLVQVPMAMTMVLWGKLVDRYPPTKLRGILNVIFAVDLLAFALAPSLEWVFLGRVFRGIAMGGGTLVWMLGSLYYARSPENAPVYLGIHTVLTGLRWGIAPFVGVWLKSTFADSARPVFFLSFLVVVATAIFMVRLSRSETPRPVGSEEAPMPSPRTPGA